MINNQNQIATRLFDRATSLDQKLNEASVVKNIFGTLETKQRYNEIYKEAFDAWVTYYRVKALMAGWRVF